MKNRNGFLYVQNLNKQWRLVLPTTLNTEGKNVLEIAIAKAHIATPYHRIEKTMKAITNKLEYQSFSHLVREYIGIYDICHRTKN